MVAISLCSLITASAIGIGLWIGWLIKDLPALSAYEDYRPQQTSYFYDRYGAVINCVPTSNGEWKVVVRPEDVKNLLISGLVIAAEDKRYWERDLLPEIDFRAFVRALFTNVRHLKIVEGGSTIPMQVVKQLLPPQEQAQRNVARKIREFVLAENLIRRRTKEEILALYLNEVYLGHQTRGVEAAARYYFNKRASELSLGEAATLAGILKSPETLSPKKHPERALSKRNEILEMAYQEYRTKPSAQKITRDELKRARGELLNTRNDFEESCRRVKHAVDDIREDMKKTYKLVFDLAGTNPAWLGLRVVTTIDWSLQQLAQEGIKIMLKEYHARQGPLAVDAEGAMVIIENGTGAILASVGGADYSRRQFNHATKGNRQVGSAFKPFVYAAKFEQELLERQADPDKILEERVSNARIRCPRKFGANPNNPDDWWVPKNYDPEKYSKPYYTRRLAIAKSVNLPAVHTGRVGNCGLNPRVIALAKKFGLTNIPPYLPSALGASSHSLLEMTRAYSVFPSGGFWRQNYIISEITAADGREYFKKSFWEPARRVVPEMISASWTKTMLAALREAVKSGTASALSGLNQPLACKTGTTDNFTDALLFCFTPDITMGVWMGYPENAKKSLGDKEFGARGAVAIKHVIENWYRGQDPHPFQEESKDWKEFQQIPDLFQKELEELKRLEAAEDVKN
ncbi:MAG: transglycosylase domain-containing protein [Candidatus Sungbacteria bacterium]|nr:transglycosylase domain-containing protein [Candidatus Sungbacteria bacterium]